MQGNTFGPILRRFRTERGFTQASLAEVAGLSRRMVEELESGRHGPSWETLQRLAVALEVSTEALRTWWG